MRSLPGASCLKMLQCFVFVFTSVFVSCKSSGTQERVTVDANLKTQVPLHLILEGPWAITPDPDPSNNGGYLAIAPNVADHGLLYMQSYDGFMLLPGEYTLQIPNIPGAGTISYSPLNEDISSATLAGIRNDKSFRRYAVHLPKPNGISEGAGTAARVDENGKWPVDPGSVSEAPYTTDVSFDYSVASDWKTMNVAGSTDPILTGLPGVAVPLSVKEVATVNGPHVIRVGTEPSNDDLGSCSTQSKGAFHTLVGLFQLKKTVDFQKYDKGCWVCDPQGPNSKPCPSVRITEDLKTVGALVDKAKPSPLKLAALKTIEKAESLITSGKGTQKELLEKVGSIKGFLSELKARNPEFAPGFPAAAEKIDQIVSITSLPAKDCKSPVLSLTVK